MRVLVAPPYQMLLWYGGANLSIAPHTAIRPHSPELASTFSVNEGNKGLIGFVPPEKLARARLLSGTGRRPAPLPQNKTAAHA
jgi:hypothetical protein